MAGKLFVWITPFKSTSQATQARGAGSHSSNKTHTEYFAAKTVTQGPFGDGLLDLAPHPPPLPPLTVTEAWMEKPSFGKPLEEHLAVSGREIAFPVEACVTMLLECGMQEEVGPCWKGGCRNRRWVGPNWDGECRRRWVLCPTFAGHHGRGHGCPQGQGEELGAPETSQPQTLSNTLRSSAQGLFRVAPSASKLKKLKAALDCCVVDVQEYSADPHAIAGGASWAGVAPPGTP